MENEKIRIVIVEDEFIIGEDIRVTLEEQGYEVAAVFDRGESALPFLLKEKADIVLVDIHLAGTLDGIDLVKSLLLKLQIPVIYITANSDPVHYGRAKVTKPHSFLVKPFSHSNLLTAVDLALYHFSTDSTTELIEESIEENLPDTQFILNQCLFIRINGKYKKLLRDDLLFIEAAGSYVHLQTKSERYTLSQNLAHFQKKTPLPNFIRIHRSYVVNVDCVDSFEDSNVFVKNHKLPLSDNYRSEFLARVHCL